MTQCSNQKKKVLNFIAVTGFILSIISIPLCPTCIAQTLALIISIIGFEDAKKCNNRGKVLGLIGIILSLILMIIGPAMLYLMIKGFIKFILVFDFSRATLFLESLSVTLKFITMLFGF